MCNKESTVSLSVLLMLTEAAFCVDLVAALELEMLYKETWQIRHKQLWWLFLVPCQPCSVSAGRTANAMPLLGSCWNTCS